MTPDMVAIKKCSSVLKSLAKRLSPDFSFTDNIQKKVGSWIDAASGALALIGGNTKLRDETGVEEHLEKDPNHSLLRAVKAARSKVLRAENEMGKLEDTVGIPNLDPCSPVVSLFQMKLPRAVATELSSERFDDCVATKCAKLHVGLSTVVEKALGLCKGLQQDGQNCWKTQVARDASFEEVCSVAASTVFLLPGKELKPITEQFEEAPLVGLETAT